MLTKTFFLEDEDTSRCQFLQLQIPVSDGLVNLRKVLQSVPEMENKSFKVFNPEKGRYEKLNQEASSQQQHNFLREPFLLNFIIIKFKSLFEFKEESLQSVESQKKQRSKERSIKEVIELIDKWRNYHNTFVNGKRRSLQEAARYVGVSKKSLDDYYYQLRVGQKHHFNFDEHLEDKIGVLRSFLKSKEPVRKPNGRNVKQPKNLTIISKLQNKLKQKKDDEISERHDQRINQQKNQTNEVKNQSEQIKAQKIESPVLKQHRDGDLVHQSHDIFSSFGDEQQFWGSPFTPMSQEKYKNCEQKFFSEFGQIKEDPLDPYLSFAFGLNDKSHLGDDFSS